MPGPTSQDDCFAVPVHSVASCELPAVLQARSALPIDLLSQAGKCARIISNHCQNKTPTTPKPGGVQCEAHDFSSSREHLVKQLAKEVHQT